MSLNLSQCLATLGLNGSSDESVKFSEYAKTLEFSTVRKAFHRRALQTHPDKGGEKAAFVAVQESFETLEKATDGGKVPLSALVGKNLVKATVSKDQKRAPSYEFVAAKTGRGKCSVSGEFIPEGALKCGSFIAEIGEYGRWTSLQKWKVPLWVQQCILFDSATVDDVKSELECADGVFFIGVKKLPAPLLDALAAHMLDKSNWSKPTAAGEASAREVAELREKLEAEQEAARATPEVSSQLSQLSEADPVAELPAPTPDAFKINEKKKMSFVLTGTFPDVGGGSGLKKGKGGVTDFIEQCGGEVKSAVSKKTSYLVASTDDAGASKVGKATELGVPVIDFDGVLALARGDEDVKPAEITGFSNGFGGNSLAARLDVGELDALKEKAATPPQPEKKSILMGGKRPRDDENEEDAEDPEEVKTEIKTEPKTDVKTDVKKVKKEAKTNVKKELKSFGPIPMDPEVSL